MHTQRRTPCLAANVVPACESSRMNLKGIELRYVLTLHLAVQGPATITELIDALSWHGFRVDGRPSKAIADALRWESAGAQCAGSDAAGTGRRTSRAAPNTGSINGFWHCARTPDP